MEKVQTGKIMFCHSPGRIDIELQVDKEDTPNLRMSMPPVAALVIGFNLIKAAVTNWAFTAWRSVVSAVQL